MLTSSVATGFGRHGMPTTAFNPDLWLSDLETGMWATSKVGNLRSKFGHARPLRCGVIRYVCDGRTDRQMDGQKQCSFRIPYSRGI